MKQRTQPFKDGVVKIYALGDISEPGNMPKEGLTLKETLRYDERTVGMSRFWTAMQAEAKIDSVLRVPQRRNVSAQDIAIPNDGEQYKIIQIQYPKDVELPVMDLSLERLEAHYEFG